MDEKTCKVSLYNISGDALFIWILAPKINPRILKFFRFLDLWIYDIEHFCKSLKFVVDEIVFFDEYQFRWFFNIVQERKQRVCLPASTSKAAAVSREIFCHNHACTVAHVHIWGGDLEAFKAWYGLVAGESYNISLASALLRDSEAEEAATGKKLFALHARFIEYRNFWGTHRRTGKIYRDSWRWNWLHNCRDPPKCNMNKFQINQLTLLKSIFFFHYWARSFPV